MCWPILYRKHQGLSSNYVMMMMFPIKIKNYKQIKIDTLGDSVFHYALRNTLNYFTLSFIE